jgi:hypothetical protein
MHCCKERKENLGEGRKRIIKLSDKNERKERRP